MSTAQSLGFSFDFSVLPRKSRLQFGTHMTANKKKKKKAIWLSIAGSNCTRVSLKDAEHVMVECLEV